MKKLIHDQLHFLIRDVLGATGAGFAKEVGIYQGLLNRYENGQTAPSVDFIYKTCTRFDISANWLILDIGPIKLGDVEIYREDTFLNSIIKQKEFKSDKEELIKSINVFAAKYTS